MSLCRPAKFPLLKLPWLCIKCVLHNSDLYDIIYFATISNRTRQNVKISNYPLKEIIVILNSESKRKIVFDKTLDTQNRRTWYFMRNYYAYHGNFVLQRNSQPFHTIRGFNCYDGDYIGSYNTVDTLDALKMGITFLIDVFGCTIRKVFVDGDKISELLELAISSVETLFIYDAKTVNITDLKILLENMKNTDKYVFDVPIPEDFYCDPQIFKCRTLSFWHRNSADWVTLEVLCQLDVPELHFLHHRFSVKDVVSYITYWFNSENRMLEYLFVSFNNPVTLGDFEIDHLNPMPFCEKRRNRCPFVGGWKEKDMSSGMDIIHKDGLLATLYVESKSIIFYIWHERFPDSVQQ